MADLATLVVRLVGDITDYQANLQTAEQDAQGFLSRGFSGLSTIGGAVVGAVGAAAIATATGVGIIAANAIQEASAAQEVEAQLNNTLANTGSITGVTADMVNQLADHFQSLTRFEDDNVTAGAEVLARFDEINSDVFPDALSLSLDLATVWKTDVPSAATVLGKALADPGEGLMRLKAAGVVFTDEQEQMIQTMIEAGDVAGAQAIIMDVVRDSVGGAAEAAGKTAAGQWDRLKNTIGGFLETLGGPMLSTLATVGGMIQTYLERPETQAFIQGLAQGIAEFGANVVAWLPKAAEWIQNAFGWLQENQGVIVAAVAVVGAAIAAFVYTTVIPAAVAMIGAMLPIIAVILIIAAVAYLIYEAWTNNWGGIQEKTAAAVAFIQNLFAGVVAFIQGVWAGVLQFISDLTGGKLGALSQIWANVWSFIQQTIQNAGTIIRAILAAFQAAFSGDWTAFGQQLRVVWDTLWKELGLAVSTAWENLQIVLKSLADKVVKFFKETDWKKVGTDIVQGIATGITSAIDWAIRAIIELGEAVLNAIKGFLGIASPSKVFKMEVGWNMGLGLREGFAESLAALQGAMPGLMSGIAPAAQGAVATANVGAGGMEGGAINIYGGTWTFQMEDENVYRRIREEFGRRYS